jgi:hypothetical protein
MNIANRIKKLEQVHGGGETACLVIVQGATDEETEINRAKAQAEWKATHPEWEPSRYDFYIMVKSEHEKETLERIAERL